MGRIIVNIGDGFSDEKALRLVSHVIGGGRVSTDTNGRCYCFLTTWSDGSAVSARLTRRGSDRFDVWKMHKEMKR